MIRVLNASSPNVSKVLRLFLKNLPNIDVYMLLRQFLRFLGHQQWLPFRIRDNIIRAFDNPDRIAAKAFEVPFYSRIYSGDLSTFIDWSTYYYGAYCREELNFMRDALIGVRDPIVLDIGANVGHHSLFASTVADQVYAFEPWSAVAAKICEKIRTNSLDNIKVCQVGLGDKNEDLPFATPAVWSNSGTGSFTHVSSASGFTMNGTLPVRNGDDYIRMLGVYKIDYIKMEIEGFEPYALRGLNQSLTCTRPICFFEWSANERKINVELNQLFPQGILDFVTGLVVFGVFAKKGYRLVAGSLCDGNKVAIPVGKLHLFSSRTGIDAHQKQEVCRQQVDIN